jgi:GNAT superfamily N-acetyltransferase
MSLYQIDAKFDRYFYPPQNYLELWKLEVLSDYQGNGYGKQLVDFAKSFGLPIKTNPRVQSHGFWEKMNFSKVDYEMERDRGENPLVWYPEGVEAQQH